MEVDPSQVREEVEGRFANYMHMRSRIQTLGLQFSMAGKLAGSENSNFNSRINYSLEGVSPTLG